jgi:hypothetical protein
MIAAVLLLAAAADFAHGGGLQQAIDLLSAGDARGALAAAEAATDAHERARARVYVLEQAGDYESALAAAHSGSDAFPADAWLAEQWSYIATTLRRSGSAARAVPRLEIAAAQQPEADREAWQQKARSALADLDALLIVHQERDSAKRFARFVSFAALGGALAVLIALAFKPSRRQRMSSTPVDASGSSKVPGGNQ